ncbi:methyltransferase domain-containing protein, partial [candidate division WWE3 bacterium]|nr:methyltransferase domain-containing protein [candidate division WWE3 bacterium]
TQLTHHVNPEKLFRHYLYVPSTSQTMLMHFDAMAADLVERFGLQGALTIDVGSNDGTLLRYFQKRGAQVLGIDPAENLAKIANEKGIPTVADFFGPKTAQLVRTQHGGARLITATNCLAHMPDIFHSVNAVSLLLDDDGVFVAEFPYLWDMLDKVEFDTIYHEHYYYLSIMPLVELFRFWGMRIFDVERLPEIHGGSIRVFACKEQASYETTEAVYAITASERIRGFDQPFAYDLFAANVHALQQALREALEGAYRRGERVIGIGAPAKASVLLNSAKINSQLLPHIVDSIPLKQGRLLPGLGIPVHAEEEFEELDADTGLVLPWNFAKEIRRKYDWFVNGGGKLFVAVPRLQPL